MAEIAPECSGCGRGDSRRQDGAHFGLDLAVADRQQSYRRRHVRVARVGLVEDGAGAEQERAPVPGHIRAVAVSKEDGVSIRQCA